MIGAELEQATYAHIPEAFFGRLLRAVFAAHRVAFEDCRDSFAEFVGSALAATELVREVEQQMDAVGLGSPRWMAATAVGGG